MAHGEKSYGAFGDLITVPLTPIAGWTFAYNVNTDIVNTTVTGSGAVTHSAPSAVLSTTAATSSSAMIQTRRVIMTRLIRVWNRIRAPLRYLVRRLCLAITSLKSMH